MHETMKSLYPKILGLHEFFFLHAVMPPTMIFLKKAQEKVVWKCTDKIHRQGRYTWMGGKN